MKYNLNPFEVVLAAVVNAVWIFTMKYTRTLNCGSILLPIICFICFIGLIANEDE